MTIKQLGGVFGRNPTFNDVTIEGQLTFDGDIDINSDLKIDGDLDVTGGMTVDTDTLVVDNATNRVGIGTDSPSQLLNLKDAAPFVKLESNSTAYNGFIANNDSGNFYFGIDGSGGSFYGSSYARAIYADGAYPVTFYTNAQERLRILSTGGITFNGDTAQANALDDYEEGTWTPAYTPTTGSFTTITTVSTGRYTKVGRLVTIFGSMRTSGTLDITGASGNLKITGLPFACNSTIAGGGSDISHQAWSLGTDILKSSPYVSAGTSEILLYKNTMNGSSFPNGPIFVSEMNTSGGSFNNLIGFVAQYEV